jgi:beta-lactamase regulating signal transducer with metallopeptidase domain
MIALLDTIGPAVLRASWQAAILALLVFALLRSMGERITPRWRYLLWSVVVARLLLVITPASPWSAFNLSRLVQEMSASRIASYERAPEPGPDARESGRFAQGLAIRSEADSVSPRNAVPTVRASAPPESAATGRARTSDALPRSGPPTERPRRDVPVIRILSTVYLAGCVAAGLQLIGAALVLRRRLSVCRPVKDIAVLAVLETAAARAGLRRLPALLVTPESISPCALGTLKPRIIVPESIVTEAPGIALRHVLAHELAHLVRGDLWTNWLLLLARLFHWFNPVAWWSIRQMQVEREAACDDSALAALGEVDRSSYASTIISLASNLAPSGVAPAMIGLISSSRRLKSRIERLTGSASVKSVRPPVAASIVLGLALIGLTDAMPAARTRQTSAKSATAPLNREPSETGQAVVPDTFTLRGRCEDFVDHTAMPGIRVRLFRVSGRTVPIVEAASCESDRDGRFEFLHLTPPREGEPVNTLLYLVFAEATDRPIGVGGIWNGHQNDNERITIRMYREKTTLAGTVVDPRGQPVAGATVGQWLMDGRPVPGILSATTGADGRFLITRIPASNRLRSGRAEGRGETFEVAHPRYPGTSFTVGELPKMVTVTLPVGSQVTGMVIDSVTGQPFAGAVVLARGLGNHAEALASTDTSGRFAMALAEDRYNVSVSAQDRVCTAITDRECLAGQRLELPPFMLTSGGFISGKVVNTATGNSIAVTERGEPIELGLIGPSHPIGKAIYPLRLAATDSAGRYKLRAAAGENFPYLVNLAGDRMAWNTSKQPAVVVKEGETTEYNMLVTPEVSPAEKLKSAQKVVASLPVKPSERLAQILAEFRKLERTVDQTELWCTLMRELVAVGRDAVPPVCAELDRTTADRTLRRLAFAMRAIGDARAVPALIRAIPRTLVPASSDYGLVVDDAALAAFMRKYELNGGRMGGLYFNFGRPVREVFGTLEKLTGQNFDDAEVFGLHRSVDPRRQWHQRQLIMRYAERWAKWWEAHWRDFTDDRAYQRVGLKVDVEPIPSPGRSPTLGPKARLDDGVMGAVLSPALQRGQFTEYFSDLDTGASPKWPAQIPQDEARFDPKQLADWATRSGVDLMCVTHRAPDGTQTFVLRSFGMKAWEISARDLRNIDKLVAAGTLPKGRDAGDLLVHYDEDSKQPVPDANAAFIFVTREGCMGLIETTDRVTRTQDITGMMGAPPRGVGFKIGVRFNLKSIIP